MNFRIEAVLPAGREAIWGIFFDVRRVGVLIPGCENVEEKEPRARYSAVMRQKIGPFKLEVPAEIVVEAAEEPASVRLLASGKDKFTGTTVDIVLSVLLVEEHPGPATRLGIDATLRVGGRLAALGYPVVKKKAEELFAEFEERLRGELRNADVAKAI